MRAFFARFYAHPLVFLARSIRQQNPGQCPKKSGVSFLRFFGDAQRRVFIPNLSRQLDTSK